MIHTDDSQGELVVGIEPATITEEKCFVAAIPNEILAQIFIDSLVDEPQMQPDVAIAPLLLCHICSLWRTVALNVPQLWEDLHLDLGHAQVRSSNLPGLLEEKMDVLEFWTSNTAHLHPSLHLSFNNRDHFFLVEHDDFLPFQKLFSLQAIQSARLLNLHRLTYWNIDTLFNSFSYTSNGETYEFPNLEIFAIAGDLVNHFFPTGQRSIIFEGTPSLHRLALNLLMSDPVYFTEFAFCWGNLTHCYLACYHIRFPRWYGFMTSCVSLVCGAFMLSMDEFRRFEPTELPNLRQLTLDFTGDIRKGVFLDLSFPSLTALRLSTINYSRPIRIEQLLVPMPSLVEFNLRSCIAVDDASDALSTFVPNLQMMVFDGFISCGSMSPSDDITKILCSDWLTTGWLSDRAHQRRIEYFLRLSMVDPSGNLRQNVAQHLASIPGYPFASVVIEHSSGPLWDWPVMTADDLENRWDEKMKFHT